MRQGACVIWTSLVVWYPAGFPQAGTLSVTWSVPARVFGSHVYWADTALGTTVKSGQPSVCMAEASVHCPLTNRACDITGPPGVEATEAHPSPQGVAYQSSVTDSPVCGFVSVLM